MADIEHPDADYSAWAVNNTTPAQAEPCNMPSGCCFCDGAYYKHCSFCGHRVCAEHVGIVRHVCNPTHTPAVDPTPATKDDAVPEKKD